MLNAGDGSAALADGTPSAVGAAVVTGEDRGLCVDAVIEGLAPPLLNPLGDLGRGESVLLLRRGAVRAATAHLRPAGGRATGLRGSVRARTSVHAGG